MSQRTTLYTTAKFVFPGKTYNNKREVELDLESERNLLHSVQIELRDLALMTEPNKFFDSKDCSLYEQISDKVNALLSEITTRTIYIIRLETLFQKWDDCHNEEGLGIDVPDDFEYKSYIGGDFVYTEKYPDNKSILN